MRFLVDAQLPMHLADSLQWWGYDALHTLDLSTGNQTKDQHINELSMAQERVVITKDADFVNSFLLTGIPFKLLLVSTGNISNRELLAIFEKNIKAVVIALEVYRFVEITGTSIIERQ